MEDISNIFLNFVILNHIWPQICDILPIESQTSIWKICKYVIKLGRSWLTLVLNMGTIWNGLLYKNTMEKNWKYHISIVGQTYDSDVLNHEVAMNW